MRIFQEVNAHLEEKGLRLSGGTIIDATIINTPSSTKNCEAHPGRVLGASSSSRRPPMSMIRVWWSGSCTGKENVVFGDSAYMGKTEEIKGKAPEALALPRTRGTENKKHTAEDKETNRLLSKTRSRVEHIILIAKKVFVFSKVRYKGLMKNKNFFFVLFALSNLHMIRRDLLEPRRA